MKTEDLFPRRCDATNKGMRKGWVWGDGAHYTSTLEETLKECRKDEEHIIEAFESVHYEAYNEPHTKEEIAEFEILVSKAKNKEQLTDNELLSIGFLIDYLYYTDWDELDEDVNYDKDGEEYQLVNGKWTNIKDIKDENNKN